MKRFMVIILALGLMAGCGPREEWTDEDIQFLEVTNSTGTVVGENFYRNNSYYVFERDTGEIQGETIVMQVNEYLFEFINEEAFNDMVDISGPWGFDRNGNLLPPEHPGFFTNEEKVNNAD